MITDLKQVNASIYPPTQECEVTIYIHMDKNSLVPQSLSQWHHFLPTLPFERNESDGVTRLQFQNQAFLIILRGKSNRYHTSISPQMLGRDCQISISISTSLPPQSSRMWDKFGLKRNVYIYMPRTKVVQSLQLLSHSYLYPAPPPSLGQWDTWERSVKISINVKHQYEII